MDNGDILEQNLPSKVAIIIPVYNDTARLRICLDALSEQSKTNFVMTVFVVDNNSSEDIKAVTQDYDFVTYLFEPKPGSYHARNRALDELEDEQYIGFTDADCIPCNQWVKEAVFALDADPKKAVGGPIDVFAESGELGSTAENYEILFAFPQKVAIEQEGYSVTANLFVTKEMLEKVGKFNCDLFSGGDLDYGQRLLSKGFPVEYIDSMLIRHPARATIKQITSRVRRCAGGSYQQRKAHKKLDDMYSWKGVLYSFRPPIKDYIKIVSSERLSLFMKLKLCMLSSYLRFSRAFIYLGYKTKFLKRMERF